MITVSRLVAFTEQRHVTRVLNERELQRLHDWLFGPLFFPRGHSFTDARVRPQMMEPFELRRTLGAAVRRFPGVSAHMYFKAVLSPESSGAIAASMARFFL
jgi:hypothetical protein